MYSLSLSLSIYIYIYIFVESNATGIFLCVTKLGLKPAGYSILYLTVVTHCWLQPTCRDTHLSIILTREKNSAQRL